jgi:hypothetical protein
LESTASDLRNLQKKSREFLVYSAKMEESNISNVSDDSENAIINNLNMYKSLNADLSKRMQEIKVTLTATTNELTNVRKELLEEKTKISRMRLHLGLLTTQSVNFISNFLTSMDRMFEENIEVSLAANMDGIRQQYGN